jgi:uncharacterized protein YbjT (DUF2867 family)
MPSALVAGATGLVGRHLVALLADAEDYHDVIVASRRPMEDAPDGISQVVVRFDSLEEHRHLLAADHVFWALGSTRRAAGSKARFREIDAGYTRRMAAVARANGARHFSLVSAIGADPRSRFFYNRVKGEAEDAVRQAGLPSAVALRPSVLGGARGGRPLERVAQAVLRIAPPRWRTIDAAAVARAAIAIARTEASGWTTYESHALRELGRDA